MLDKVGYEFWGVVSGVVPFGLFIELKEIYVEGLIHVSQLGQEYYHYDPVKHIMVGEVTRQSYHLGQEVQVRVVRVDLEDKKIDFELIGNQKSKKTHPKKGKHASKKHRRRYV